MFEETELVIDPAFFTALKQRFAKIGRVQIQLARGRHHNEMTQFRYNVILHIESSSPAALLPDFPAHSWLDWSKDKLTVSAVRQRLVETQPEILGITQIPNARVMKAVKAAQWLSSTEEPKTVGQFRAALQELSSGVDPENWTFAKVFRREATGLHGAIWLHRAGSSAANSQWQGEPSCTKST